MTKIKLCGLTRISEIETANRLRPEYIGFVFAPKSSRYLTPQKAMELKQRLNPQIKAVGVFVNEMVETVADFLNRGLIDLAQLHGEESEEYIKQLRKFTNQSIIKAFCIKEERDVADAEQSTADYILLDSGAGTGRVFDWNLIQNIKKPYFLAGGLKPDNVEDAVKRLHPYAVDVSSGIETGGVKDLDKIAAFVAAVRKEEET